MVLMWPFVFYLFVFLRCARFLHIGDTMLFPITPFFASVGLRVTLENHKCSLRWRTWLNIPAEHQHVNIVSVSTLAQLHRATSCCSLLAWLVKSTDTSLVICNLAVISHFTLPFPAQCITLLQPLSLLLVPLYSTILIHVTATVTLDSRWHNTVNRI